MTKNEMHALAIGVKAFSDIRQELMGGLDYRKLHGMAKIALVEVTAILSGAQQLAQAPDLATAEIAKRYKPMWDKRGQGFTSIYLYEWYVTLFAVYQYVESLPTLFEAFLEMVMNEWGYRISKMAKERDNTLEECKDISKVSSELFAFSPNPIFALSLLTHATNTHMKGLN